MQLQKNNKNYVDTTASARSCFREKEKMKIQMD